MGYGAVSPMLRGSDGAYYSLINLHGPDSGRCPFRAVDITDPSGFRGRGPSGVFDHRWRSPYLAGPPGSRCAKLNSSESKAAPHTNVRRIVSDGPLEFVSFGGGGGSGVNVGIGYSFSQQPAYEKALTEFGERQTLVLDGLSRWGGRNIQASYPSLLDHASPRLGRAIGDDGSIEDGDNYMLTNGDAELYVYFGSAGNNLLRRRVHFSSTPPAPPPPPPPPLPAGCATLLVSGAGRASANGLYHRVPGKTSDGMPLFQAEDTAHQIRRVDSIHDGHIWQLARDETSDEALCMTLSSSDKNAASLMPLTNGWRCEMTTVGARVVPASVVSKGKTDDDDTTVNVEAIQVEKMVLPGPAPTLR